MLYYLLKIIHILTAALLLLAMVRSYFCWKKADNADQSAVAFQQIQTQTWGIIAPSALLQLMTGFTIISLQGYRYSEFWIMGSTIGFIIVIGSWFSFMYFLLLAQQTVAIESCTQTKFKFFRRIQSWMLMVCFAAIASMIFFMANKV